MSIVDVYVYMNICVFIWTLEKLSKDFLWIEKIIFTKTRLRSPLV